MEDEKTVLTVFIGENDIYEWVMGEGKETLMPELLSGCEIMIDEKLESYHCARIETIVRGLPKAFDFHVKIEEIENTLEKIMEWALETEEYEMCQRVKNIEAQLHNEDFSYRR